MRHMPSVQLVIETPISQWIVSKSEKCMLRLITCLLELIIELYSHTHLAHLDIFKIDRKGYAAGLSSLSFLTPAYF